MAISWYVFEPFKRKYECVCIASIKSFGSPVIPADLCICTNSCLVNVLRFNWCALLVNTSKNFLSWNQKI